MKLIPNISVPYTKLFAFYKTEQNPTNGYPLDKERLGLKRNSKTFSADEWKEVYKEIDELADEDTKVENFKHFGSVHFWLNAGFSISKILRMIASLDEDFNIVEKQRRALNVIFQTIIHEGCVTREYSGNTLINRPYLIKFITDQEYDSKKDVWFKKAQNFRYAIDIDKDSREVLDFKEAEINEILDYAIENGVLGTTTYQGVEHVYYTQHKVLEEELLNILKQPSISTFTVDTPPELTEKQALMFNTVLNSRTVGIINLGEPGTGKSYSAEKYIEATGARNWLVLATTGTAAQVLQASVPKGVSCSTISWAAFNRDKVEKKRYVLVDECSMLNITFLKQLKMLIDTFEFEKIVLLGDPHQLPPVGVGAFFASFDSDNTYGVELVTFSEQKRMTQKAMKNLRSLTAQSSPTAENLFGFGYADVPFYTQEDEGQKSIPSSVLNVLKSLEKRLTTGFTEESMKDKKSRVVVSTFKNKWADFYSEMIEGMRRGLTEPASIVSTVSDILRHYEANPLVPPTDKPWKLTSNFIQFEIFDTLWGRSKPSVIFESKYHEVADEITIIKELKRQLHHHLLTEFPASGGWYRSNRNIWTSKITTEKLIKLKKKFKITEIQGDIANGTKFICKSDEEGFYFEACDTTAMVRFDPTAKITNFLSLAWVQTTHKLQGDQGVESLYIHDKEAPMSLVYVALSRGRSRNYMVTPCLLWQGKYNLCHRNFQRLSTLCIENNVI